MSKSTELITQERLKEVLSYDPSTGLFRWIKALSRKTVIGDIAGAKMRSAGYFQVDVDKRTYLLHRLAWLWEHGEFPSLEIDHINGDRGDNRIENLRNVSHKTNAQNKRTVNTLNKSGFLGVVKRGDRYLANITHNGKTMHIGVFKTPEAAHAAYVETKRELHQGCTL